MRSRLFADLLETLSPDEQTHMRGLLKNQQRRTEQAVREQQAAIREQAAASGTDARP